MGCFMLNNFQVPFTLCDPAVSIVQLLGRKDKQDASVALITGLSRYTLSVALICICRFVENQF